MSARRDLEILRALLRVRYLTTRQINAAFFWMTKLQVVLQGNGMQQLLYQAEPALMKEGHDQLTALYRALKELEGRGARP